MKSTSINAVYNALKAYVWLYVSAGFFDRVVEKVKYLMTVPDLTGEAKMKLVLEFAQAELVGFNETLVRGIVQVYLLKVKNG